MKWLSKLLIGIGAAIVIYLATMSIANAAQSITFGWDANMEADLAGYRLYEKAILVDGTPNYTLITEIGKKDTVTTISAPDLIDRTWVLTAFDTSNNESGYSNEAGRDTVPPTSPGGFKITVVVEVNTP